MTATALPDRRPPDADAARALSAAARVWLLTAVIGQWLFFVYIAGFYGPSTLSGDIAAWSRNSMLLKGYVPGDTAGNIAFGAHALLAGIIAFGGALQLAPQLRSRWPALHRWNGRLFMVVAIGVSLTGFYMVWVRHTWTSLLGATAISLNGLLIIGSAIQAWRAARGGDLVAHRRWALRLYLVANAQWFTRVGFFAWLLIGHGLFHAPKALTGQVFDAWSFGCFLVPLGVLDLYLRAKDSTGSGGRIAMAGGLAVLTTLMAVGIFAYSGMSLSLLTKT
jgi:uncharacterized membrane protein